MFKRYLLSSLLCAVVLLPVAWQSAIGQQPAAAKEGETKAKGRLPNNYGKVGLTAAQKESIYKIQADYRDRIATLEKQIDDMTSKRDAEIRAVLTAEQQAQLDKLLGETKARAAAKKSD